MGWSKINIPKYVAEVKRGMGINIPDDIIEKDLLLTLILAEFEKEKGVFNELIFKGGTLLSRNYLNYHRFSEDLDFVYINSDELRVLTRNQRERRIKTFIDFFVPQLKKTADTLGLDFSTDRSNTKYCSILSGRAVYVFRVYYSSNNYIKIEINFVEKLFYKPIELSVKAITDFFDSKELFFALGIELKNFSVLSYSIDEIILEKYRALLTRPRLKERDLFDLFLIKNSLEADVENVIVKIKNASLIKKELDKIINHNLQLLKSHNFFDSDEIIEDLAIVKYDQKSFKLFKEKIQDVLIRVCESFYKQQP